MTRQNTPPHGDFLDLILISAQGLFPGALLEALIARMEGAQ